MVAHTVLLLIVKTTVDMFPLFFCVVILLFSTKILVQITKYPWQDFLKTDYGDFIPK